MKCKCRCENCTCGRVLSRTRMIPANGNFVPTERPVLLKRKSFRDAAIEASVRYKESMKILA